jgi:hypothetical protein
VAADFEPQVALAPVAALLQEEPLFVWKTLQNNAGKDTPDAIKVPTRLELMCRGCKRSRPFERYFTREEAMASQGAAISLGAIVAFCRGPMNLLPNRSQLEVGCGDCHRGGEAHHSWLRGKGAWGIRNVRRYLLASTERRCREVQSRDQCRRGRFAGRALRSADGRDRAYLHVHDDIGGVSFALKDEHGARVLAVVGPDGTPALGLTDETGSTRVKVTVQGGGAADVRLNDRHENVRASIAVDADGIQGLFITDARGAIRMKLMVLATGEPTIGLLAEDGQPQAAIGLSDKTGSPQVVLFDRAGKPKLALHVGFDGVARDLMRPWWKFWR